MNSDDYKSVDTVKQALGSIARLGRAAAVHLALACQRASGSTVSTDLKNNIQMSVLLGAFESGASTLMFEKDISNLAKPEIKGRGFVGTGNDVIETQTYFTQPHLDWEFDTNMFVTFNNPEFEKQCKTKGIDVDKLNTGWVKQIPLDKLAEEQEEEIPEDDNVDTNDDEDNIPDPPDIKEEEVDWEDEWEEEDLDEDDKKEDSSTEDITGKKISEEELGEFLDDDNDSSSHKSEPLIESIESVVNSNRDRVTAALDSVDIPKPKIKLNIDKTPRTIESPKKLKLNSKKKD